MLSGKENMKTKNAMLHCRVKYPLTGRIFFKKEQFIL